MLGSFEYNTDLFDAATIVQMIIDFETLLRAVVARPDARLSEARQMLEDAESQLRVTWAREIKENSVQRLQNIRRRPVRRGAQEGEREWKAQNP